MFSYYLGLLGYDQTQRVLDNFNGGIGYPTEGIVPFLSTAGTNVNVFPNGPFPRCNPDGSAPTGGWLDVGCAGLGPFALGTPAVVTDREAVANFHIGVPHKHDARRDDIQLLYSGSSTRRSTTP